MNEERVRALRELLRGQEVAALGTLHEGEPFVSMVPYALLPRGRGFVVHVSRLASHTRDMEQHAGVSLLVLGERAPELPAQALPRATIQGEARALPRGTPAYEEARWTYLARFPQAEELFTFADFSLFLVAPQAVRFVGGFGQAWSATAETFAEIMAVE